MKRGALALAVLLLLLGCGAGETAEEPVISGPAWVVDVTPEKEESTEPERREPADPDFSYVDFEPLPWQQAYLDLLWDICREEFSVRERIRADGTYIDDTLPADGYCLYDVDKDETPELFLRWGNCEANYSVEVYTVRDGGAVSLGVCHFGHSSLYSWPGENGAVIAGGHMGYAWMEKLGIVDGELTYEEFFSEDNTEEPDAAYTEVDALVPGSVYVSMTRVLLDSPMPMTVPIYAYGREIEQIPQVQGAEAAIRKVVEDGAAFYGVSATAFDGDIGWTTLEEVCRPGVLDVYARQQTAAGLAWVDMNGDGQRECAVRLVDAEDGENRLVLSWQDGVVYGYCERYNSMDLDSDGVFYKVYSDEYCSSYGLLFYKNQCDWDFGKAHREDASPVTWETLL